ncbi:sugar ABC transporter substrate-binding protein [Niveispirillum lacus]|uniref:Probable sugar-binding periplasmic protein n=2 Tax=Niveispirillum lacus TaxID=1981099 RepID=A0A255YYD7_9PROT|nr:sugar ABC transporter substrate-binding protein [Niveispirillum lacus]
MRGRLNRSGTAAKAMAIACLAFMGTASAAQELEVMHWLTSGGESASLSVVRQAYRDQGGVWRDAPVPGGSAARAAAVNRILGGKPPPVFLFSLGAQLTELSSHGLVIGAPGAGDEWDRVLPPLLARSARYQGQYMAAPLNIHGENWMFYNRALLNQAGLAVPRTWDAFIAAAAKLKTMGKTPIALGGQPWQERLLFNAVLLGVGGRDFYRRVYEALDEAALSSPTMLAVFRTFAGLRPFVDEGSPGRRWNQATAMLMRGDAAFQFMGDWAKGDIKAAGMEPGVQIGCALAPAPDPAYIMVVDAFAFTRPRDRATAEAQKRFVSVMMDPAVQAGLNRAKGSIPVRTDVPDDGFDICAKQAMALVRDPATNLASTGMGLSGGMAGAVDDAISHFWNDPRLTPEQGQELLRKSILAFR